MHLGLSDEAMAAPTEEISVRGRPPSAGTIMDLPELAVTHAASYLAGPSRVMFAVAMAAPSASWGTVYSRGDVSEATRAILGGETWEVLDFEDVEKSLASKLTDDDVESMLMFIDARRNLKKLKLSGCVNITGRCLEVFSGSPTLEHIDLTLVGLHESPDISPDPLISEGAVLPILHSILDVAESSLKLVVLPKKWRGEGSFGNRSPALRNFMQQYNILLDSRGARCTNCSRVCARRGNWFNRGGRPDSDYCTQLFICHGCATNFCYRRECRGYSHDGATGVTNTTAEIAAVEHAMIAPGAVDATEDK